MTYEVYILPKANKKLEKFPDAERIKEKLKALENFPNVRNIIKKCELETTVPCSKFMTRRKLLS